MPESTVRPRRDLWIPTLDEARNVLGGRLPSIIEKISFTKLVPVYLANGLGFNRPGRKYLDESVIPALENVGCFVLDPFAACGEFLDPSFFDGAQTVADQKEKWRRFNEVIGVVNYGLLIPRAKVLFALMEGYPTDEGVAAEAAYFASNFGPVVGVRTDFRLAENPATGTNPAVSFFMGGKLYGGDYFEGQGAYEEGYEVMKRLVVEIRNAS